MQYHRKFLGTSLKFPNRLKITKTTRTRKDYSSEGLRGSNIWLKIQTHQIMPNLGGCTYCH